MSRTPFNTDGGVHEIPLPVVAGRLWLCGKHAIAPDPAGLLGRVGASTVVCLVENHELADRYPAYLRWLHVAEPTVAVRFAIHDLSAPPFEAAVPFVEDLVARLHRGDGLVVHCGAGIGRAGTTAAAVLVLLGVPLDDALAHVRAHRPMAGPEVGPQLELLQRLAAGDR